MRIFRYILALCLCVSAVNQVSPAQSGGSFTITKSVIAGGGGRAREAVAGGAGAAGQPGGRV